MNEIFNARTAGLPRPDMGTLMARSAAAEWQDSGAPGFWMKPLYDDPDTGERTSLMKVDAGAWSPSHAHSELEQFFVIEGSFNDDENTYGPGDFAIRAPGAMHTASSKEGALLLLIYSPER